MKCGRSSRRIVRFPGGCFADSYDWRDGIGPKDKRPRRTNFWSFGDKPPAPASHRYDPNQFGTNEFVQFCRLIGGQPYLAANLRSLPAEEFNRWVEYCNSPAGSTTLADERAAAGFKDPFNVRYWGVGNESWGCGGNFTAQEYAVEYRRYTTWVPDDTTANFRSSPPARTETIATGRAGSSKKSCAREKTRSTAFSVVRCTTTPRNLSRGKSTDWFEEKGDALKFDPGGLV